MIPAQIEVSPLWEIAKLIVPALLAGIGAWIGGKLSVSREIEKVRNERAFDQRLDWYRRAARGIAETQWFLQNFSRAFAAKDVARTKQLGEEREATKVAREADMREMILFASRATIAALNRANTQAATVIKGSVLAPPAAQAAIRELNQAYFTLANDVREHLGMERLTVQDAQAISDE
jgi:hypothetical protein